MARRPIGEPNIPPWRKPYRLRPPQPIKMRGDYDLGGFLSILAVTVFGAVMLLIVVLYVRALP